MKSDGAKVSVLILCICMVVLDFELDSYRRYGKISLGQYLYNLQFVPYFFLHPCVNIRKHKKKMPWSLHLEKSLFPRKQGKSNFKGIFEILVFVNASQNNFLFLCTDLSTLQKLYICKYRDYRIY